MKLAVKFFQKTFTNESSKKAYLDACKWVAKNVISQSGDDTFWKMVKNKENSEGEYELTLELYALIDDKELDDSFCNRCREIHSSFWLNQKCNCNECNKDAYVKQAQNKLRIKKGYRKELLKRIIEDNEDE